MNTLNPEMMAEWLRWEADKAEVGPGYACLTFAELRILAGLLAPENPQDSEGVGTPHEH